MKEKNIPTVLIIFGATGDLMNKKIAPALFFLHKNKHLPDKFKVLGFSRRQLSDRKFRAHIFSILKEKKLVKKINKDTNNFLRRFHFQAGNFADYETYKRLKIHLDKLDSELGVCANKIFYLAVPPGLIKSIARNLKRSGLSAPCGGPRGWARLLVEKPFGLSGQSARALDKVLNNAFREEQIYRLDHYLGKEMVRGILNFRFSNNLLEHNWRREHIEKIEMKLLEKIGVEGRGGFYDQVGALRDVGQNHLLEILALLTMDNPFDDSDYSARSARVKLLKTLPVWSEREVKKNTFRAQYIGYRRINGVKANSHAETYFKLILELKNSRWANVPISIESGKRVGRVQKKVVITFKHPSPCLCQANKHPKNKIIFSLHPKQGIVIEFLAKKPGLGEAMESRKFNFLLYHQKSKTQYVEEYAKLFLDCIAGDQTWFTAREEIKYMWDFVDPIERAWRKNVVPVHLYKADKADILKTAAAALVPSGPVSPATRSVGLIGLGKMGGNLARRLREKGWRVVGYNKNAVATRALEKAGLRGADSIKELVAALPAYGRVVWLMVPAGKAVDEVLFGQDGLVHWLKKGDLVIDGGNSFYEDTIRRYKKLAKFGIKFLDCGVSGGPEGARNGASLMIGGEKREFEKVEALFADIAQENGYQFFAGAGAGHFVKMAHNGIEYGMMQALAEGFTLLKKAKFNLNLKKVASVYNQGSVIESRLISWLGDAFDIYGENLTAVSGRVDASGEGEWTVKTARGLKLKTKVIEAALKFRLQSADNISYTGKVVSAMRGQFGGHNVTGRVSRVRKK